MSKKFFERLSALVMTLIFVLSISGCSKREGAKEAQQLNAIGMKVNKNNDFLITPQEVKI